MAKRTSIPEARARLAKRALVAKLADGIAKSRVKLAMVRAEIKAQRRLK